MSKSNPDAIANALETALNDRKIEVLRIGIEPGFRKLDARLCQGAEISLVAEFGFQWLRKPTGTLVLTYSVVIRWPRAEELVRIFKEHPPSNFETKELVRVGQMSHQSAQ